jgi:HK97 family phage major capsid protein
VAYDNIIARGADGDPLVPEPMVQEVIKEAVQGSAILQQARRVTMSSKTQRQPVLSVLPQAYWVTGDTGLKQTTKAEWDNIDLVAEEIAVIVPVPEAYIADSGIPIWNEVRPLIGQAIGAKLDQACLFGTDAPSTFGTSVFESAEAAGNVVTAGTGDDLAVDVASLGELLAVEGYSLTGFMSRPGFQWRLVGLRTSDGTPIYSPNLQGAPGQGLFGRPLNEVGNGAWSATDADLIGGDFSKAIVGVRQDITFRVFTEGVISDDSGNVVLNLMQQDSVALRVVARFGFAVANPVNTLGGGAAGTSPFGILAPASV